MLKIKETIKNNVKHEIPLKGMIEDARKSGERASKYKNGNSVNVKTTKTEFEKRYSNLSFSLNFLFFCIIINIVIIGLYFSLNTIFICALTSAIMSMFCFKYSFIAWRSRYIYKNWDKRFEDNAFEAKDFTDALIINPMEIFPLKLKE